MNLSGIPTPIQKESGSNRNYGVLHIPQISKASFSLSDCCVSYPVHSLVAGGGVTPLQRCNWYILQPQPT